MKNGGVQREPETVVYREVPGEKKRQSGGIKQQYQGKSSCHNIQHTVYSGATVAFLT
jgi:hypothetical protein